MPSPLLCWFCILLFSLDGGNAMMMSCGNDRIDDNNYVCCNDIGHVKSWLNDTECCDMYAFNPKLESCCNGLVNPGFGANNRESKCCGDFSYDERCYSCESSMIRPDFDFRYQTCCNGNVRKLLSKKTCCCGSQVFDPTDLVCCDGKIVKRPDDMPGDCCSCGLTLVDIAVVLDSSESITAPNWPKMLDFTKAIFSDADIDDDNVRVGVMTYRHNTTVEFHLDDYHNKKKMFEAIDKIPYVRGSTNTGMALEMMRTDMFDPRKGDRPNVDNVCIVITDGDSDVYDHTIAQANRARDVGIHIFAIGIALKNQTELKNIATPSRGNKNVLYIDDFDNLKSLKGRIFASICTGTPIITIYKPCGKDWYNPAIEVCCNGKPQPMVDGDKTECCDQQSYSQKEDICCQGVVNQLKGKGTVCCGRHALSPITELCCKDNPVPRANKEYSECCDMYAYDPKTEICCDGSVSKAFGDPKKDTECCDGFSYDKRCWECRGGRIRPMFDPECQICCDGVIHNMTIGLSCCCGEEIFKPDISNQICCNNKLRKRQGAEKDHTCCECGSAYVDIVFVLDSSESVGVQNWQLLLNFVQKIIANSEVDTGRTRIGVETYRHNITVDFHLNTYLRAANMIEHVKNIPYVRGSTNTGEAIEVMFTNMFTSKGGDRNGIPNIAIIVTDGSSDEPARTMRAAGAAKADGVHIYAVAVGMSVSDELKAIATAPWKDNLFVTKNFNDLDVLKTKLFNLISDVCPQEPKKKEKKPCGEEGKMYDPRTEVCCNGEPQPIRVDEKTTKCCDQTSYNVKSQMCCAEKVNNRPIGAKKPQCCETTAYDPVESICCSDNVVLPKSSSGATECCGMTSYNPKTELCCEGGLYDNYGKTGQAGACCVLGDNTTTSYDTRCYDCHFGELNPRYDCSFQRCCNGVIQEIYSPSSCCCGSKAFDPWDQICCDGKLSKRQPKDDRQCCECAKSLIDIIIVMDSSESVGLDNWRKMELFVEDLIRDSDVPSARFGLLLYKHDVEIQFHLNQYFDKKSLLAAVDNVPYKRGSTNTGFGLETMRGMFDARHGDRKGAPNYCLLLTDGESDEYGYTIQQAALAKKKGIKIIALGVGLKNVTEIRNVASAPADDNAIALKDFEELTKIKQRIFTDISSSVCPQMPKDRCRTPCGNSSIDERMEICCDGVPQKKIAGDNTMCCGTVAYDPDCFMCCEDHTMANKYAGDATECCCKHAYDTRSQMCCGNHILPKVGGDDFTQCCHNDSYDIRTHVCCDYITVQPSFGEANTDCCNGISYDNRCHECKGGIRTIYDEKEELCCNGKVQKKKFKERSCCCGKDQFDADGNVCCGGNLLDRSKDNEDSCCDDKSLNPLIEICCNGKAQPKKWGLETGCCGEKSYDPSKHHCCEGNLNKKKTSADTCCCGKKVFNNAKQICCDSKVNKLAVKGARNSSVCCGSKAFDPTRKICCNKKVSKLLKGASTTCCGSKTYDVSKQICDKGRVRSISGECAKRKYNPKSQICCNGWINNATFDDPYSRCCFGEAYDSRKHVCCCNGHMEEAIAGIYTQCCYSLAYDSRTHTCCDGQIVRKPYPSAECCCGRQAYDSNREICCGGVVQPCGEDRSKCCDKQAYDPVLRICCGGKLFDRTWGQETYCCGGEAYTPTLAVCCGHQIAYRKQIDLTW